MNTTPTGSGTSTSNTAHSPQAIFVRTDDGHLGIGSVFTDAGLVEAAIAVLRPLLIGERADEPARVVEKLNQNSFWMGRGGSLTHAISGIDIALWDIFGQITGQPIGRLLGGTYRSKVKAYASILMEMPDLMRERTSFYKYEGFRVIKIGWGPFGRRESARLDEQIIKAAREGAGDDCLLMVDAGASDAFWPNGLNWAVNTVQMLKDYDVYWAADSCTLVLDDTEETAGFVFSGKQSFTLTSTRLHVDVAVTNRSAQRMPFGLGLHPWFPRHGDARATLSAQSILLEDEQFEALDLAPIPAEQDFGEGREPPRAYQNRCYAEWDGVAHIDWRALGMGLTITAEPVFRHLMFHVPAHDPETFCLEPQSNRTSAFDGVDRGSPAPGVHIIAPGETLAGRVDFVVRPPQV